MKRVRTIGTVQWAIGIHSIVVNQPSVTTLSFTIIGIVVVLLTQNFHQAQIDIDDSVARAR